MRLWAVVIAGGLVGLIIGPLLFGHFPEFGSVAGAVGGYKADRQVIIPAGGGNECRVDISANGRSFRVLLDSGATGSMPLVFGHNHARALGFDPGALSYRYTYSSANGDGHFAKVTLREVRLQSFVLYDVPAQITEAEQSQPLLGAEILHKLNFQLSNGHCLLTLPDNRTAAR